MVKGESIREIRKKVTKTYELIATSYHEAGHTVYALLHYMRVNSVYVFEHKVFKRMHGFTYYQTNELDKDHVDFIPRLEQEIGLSYAGLLAERHHFKIISGTDRVPMFIKEGSSEDFREISKLLKKYNVVPAGKKRSAYKRKISKETLDTLIRYWEAVDLVSHDLFKHKRLTFQDLKILLTKKSGDKRFWKELFKDIEEIYPN